MNDAIPVMKAATRNNRVSVVARASAGVGRLSVCACGSRRTSVQTVSASAMLSSPAVMIAPGRPNARIITKPLTSTPIAAPMLLVK